MRTLAWSLAALLGGYVAGALLGAGAVALLSGNSHDRSLEMAMTAAFVSGPIGAVLGLATAYLRRRRRT